MSTSYTTRAFAPLMAKAAKLSIVEVCLSMNNVSIRPLTLVLAPPGRSQAENIVEIGEISPMQVDLPGIFIDRIVPATAPKQIEITTLRHSSGESNEDTDPAKRRRMRIARRAAQELKDGYYVNLGVGMPVLAASFLPEGVKVWLQSENGILGMGPYPEESEVDAYVAVLVVKRERGNDVLTMQ
jgi:3-oxoacid CoA-transferase